MKRIFFVAALATVAIGGAISANAATYYSSTQSYDCSQVRTECSSISETIYDNPELQGTPVVKSNLAGTFYN